MRGRFMGLIVSAVLSTLSVVLFFHPGLHLGIDFAGGIVMEVRTPKGRPTSPRSAAPSARRGFASPACSASARPTTC